MLKYVLVVLKCCLGYKTKPTSLCQYLSVWEELGYICCPFPTGHKSWLPRRKQTPHLSVPACVHIHRQPAYGRKSADKMDVGWNKSSTQRSIKNISLGSDLDDVDTLESSNPAGRLLISIVSQTELSIAIVAPTINLQEKKKHARKFKLSKHDILTLLCHIEIILLAIKKVQRATSS